jgi:nitrite reductase/ring-hydroxylating ferredoxin subunit/uncharacterized membrane protein
MKRLLQGRPLGHPLHVMLVHLPIGLWGLSFALDVIALFDGASEKPMGKPALYTLVAGLFFAIPAAITGLADYSDIRRDHPARKDATWHLWLNVSAILVFSVSAVIRLTETGPAPLHASVSALGVALILYSGFLGGKMIYDDGVGVGRHRRTHDASAQTLVVNAPHDDGFVDVMDASELSEGIPVRADVNGHVLVIVRLGGHVFAFQEFCTHRFGPLSEGAIAGGRVTCPWHRSCFDVTTGKVVDGPAKADLKTYVVREETGRIRIEIPSG